MQLHGVRLCHFRSIHDSGELRLRPVTLLVGPNEAGKSSLLHALAMLKQTVESADPAAALLENGRLVELGAYRQLVYLHETSRDVGFELGMGGMRAGIHCAYSVRRKSVYLRRFELRAGEGAPLLSVSADNAGKIEHVEIAEPAGAAPEPRILGTIRRERCWFQPVPAWERWGEAAGRPIVEIAASPQFFHQCASGVGGLEAALRRMTYLGPDRAVVPTAAHITGNALPDVGARGENAAALLHAHRYANEAAPALKYAAAWLERLNIGQHLRVIPIEEHLYEVTIEDPQTGLVMNLSEAGRAARQLFPLLVQSFLAEPGATLLLEEPESHLHPQLQLALADVLVETARRGRRLLVETYSEALLRRLQQRVQEGALAAEELGVYFAQKLDGITQFSEVTVEADGGLRDWPADFWSEGRGEA